MTTVINLNFLNFFGPGADNHAAHDTRLNTRSSGQQHNSSSQEGRIIDVTPRSTNQRESRPVPVAANSDQIKRITPQAMAAMTYDRRGNSVQYAFQKGQYIDSYA